MMLILMIMVIILMVKMMPMIQTQVTQCVNLIHVIFTGISYSLYFAVYQCKENAYFPCFVCWIISLLNFFDGFFWLVALMLPILSKIVCTL